MQSWTRAPKGLACNFDAQPCSNRCNCCNGDAPHTVPFEEEEEEGGGGGGGAMFNRRS
jgi:hypothetical protein